MDQQTLFAKATSRFQLGDKLGGYYESDLIDHQIEFLKECDKEYNDPIKTDEEYADDIFEDWHFWQIQHEDIMCWANNILNENNLISKPLIAIGHLIGWQNLSGIMTIEPMDTAEEIFNKLLPDTHVQWLLYKCTIDKQEGIALHVFHHDSPTGEFHYLFDGSDIYCPECEEFAHNDDDVKYIKDSGMCHDCIITNYDGIYDHCEICGQELYMSPTRWSSAQPKSIEGPPTCSLKCHNALTNG